MNGNIGPIISIITFIAFVILGLYYTYKLWDNDGK